MVGKQLMHCSSLKLLKKTKKPPKKAKIQSPKKQTQSNNKTFKQPLVT